MTSRSSTGGILRSVEISGAQCRGHLLHTPSSSVAADSTRPSSAPLAAHVEASRHRTRSATTALCVPLGECPVGSARAEEPYRGTARRAHRDTVEEATFRIGRVGTGDNRPAAAVPLLDRRRTQHGRSHRRRNNSSPWSTKRPRAPRRLRWLGLGLGLIAQLVPFHRSISVFSPSSSRLRAARRAHTRNARTARLIRVATITQLVPFHR